MAARIIYDSQRPGSVYVTCADMPDNAKAYFVDEFNKVYGNWPLPAGDAPVELPTENIPTGQYYVSARESADSELARTVKFYITAS